MVVHPAPGNLTGTLVNAVLHHCNLPEYELPPEQGPQTLSPWPGGRAGVSQPSHRCHVAADMDIWQTCASTVTDGIREPVSGPVFWH
jgi:hypothetical protein